MTERQERLLFHAKLHLHGKCQDLNGNNRLADGKSLKANKLGVIACIQLVQPSSC